MVDVIPYKHQDHAGIVGIWLLHHGMSPALSEQFPENSFVALHGREIVAAIGLGKSDSSYASILGLATNPLASSEVRHAAIDALVKKVIQVAKYLEFKQLMAWTIDRSVLERALKYGFKETAQIMLTLDI